MKKILAAMLVPASLIAFSAPVFAEEIAEEMKEELLLEDFSFPESIFNLEMTEEIELEMGPEMEMMSDPYFYNPGINIWVETKTEVEFESINLTASYGLYNQSITSKEEARKMLEEKYETIKGLLKPFAAVEKNSPIEVYSSYRYDEYTYEEIEGQYWDGYLDFTVTPRAKKDFENVTDILERQDFDYWYQVNVDPETQIKAELKAAPQLKKLIDMKKQTYETILGYELEEAKGLTINSWVDTYNFDPSQSTATLNVNASINY